MRTISTIIDDPILTPELKTTFEGIKKELKAPFVPNFFKIWGTAPEALKGIFPAMQHILTSGKLDRNLKEMIMIAISSKQCCSYCETAHSAFSGMMGGTEEQIKSLQTDNTLSESDDEKAKAAIDFAVKLSYNASSSSEEDFKHLMSLGYTKSQVMEIIAMSGLGVFYNHLADATKVNIDLEFAGATMAAV